MTSNSDKGGSATGAPKTIEFDDAPEQVSDFNWIDIPGLLALWVLAVIVFLQFFTRYILNDSLAWTEEIARYVLIALAYLGAISVSRKGTHIFLEFFYRYLSPTISKVVAVIMELIVLVTYGYLAWLAADLALQTKTAMASAPIPKALVYWVVSVSLALMCVYSVWWFFHKLRQKPTDLVSELEEHALAEISNEGH